MSARLLDRPANGLRLIARSGKIDTLLGFYTVFGSDRIGIKLENTETLGTRYPVEFGFPFSSGHIRLQQQQQHQTGFTGCHPSVPSMRGV